MSDYFASAFVRVKADPKQLRADLEKLKTSVSNQVFRVKVSADARGFKAQIQEKIGRTPIGIPVTPDVKGFKTQIQEKIGETPIGIPVTPDVKSFKAALREKLGNTPIGIPVTPDARGFKAALQEKVTKTSIAIPVKPDTKGFRAKMLEQLKGLKVPVEVIPTAPAKVSAAARTAALSATPVGAGAGAGAAAGGIAVLTKEEERLKVIQDGLIETQLHLDAAFEEGLTAEQQKARLQEALTASTKASAAASRELAAAYGVEAVEALKTIAPLQERAALQRLEVESAIARGSLTADSTAAADQAAAEAEKAHETVLRSLTAAQIRYDAAVADGLSPQQTLNKLHQAAAAAESAEATVIRQIAAARISENAELEASLTPLRERASLLAADVKLAIDDINAEGTRAAAIKAGAAAQEKANGLLAHNVSAITKASDLTALNTELKGAAAEVETALALAIEAENTTLEANLVALGADIEAMQALIVTQRESVASSALMAEKLGLARRGFIATALSALGARGATLAASSEFLIAAAAATALFKSVSSAAKFQTELATFAATAGATAEEMQQVSDKAKQLGNDLTLPGVNAQDAAVAMTELAKAGLSVQDSIAGSRGVLQLSTAANIDNAQATELVASALNAFGLAGNNAVRVADLLTGSAIESQGSITDMGIALQQSAAAARQAGLSVQDTVALLTLLAKNGLKGSDAGTSLRTALIRLINPTDKAAKVLEDLKLQIRDVQGNVRPEVFADLGTQLGKLSAKQRDAALATIFGQDAFRSAAIFAREGAAGLDEMRIATQKQGLTAQLAAARTTGLSGDVEALKNSAATAGLSLGQILIPGLELLAKGINADILVIGKFLEAIRKITTLDFNFPGKKSGGSIIGDIFGKPGEIGRKLDELTAGIPVIHSFFDPISGNSAEAQKALDKLNSSFTALAGNVVPLASEIQDAFQTGKFKIGEKEGTGGPNAAVAFVEKLKEQIKDTTPQAEELRAVLDTIIRGILALGRAPTDIELRTLLDTGSIPDQLVKVQGEISSKPPLLAPLGFKADPNDVKSVAKDSVVFLEHAADIAAAKGGANAAHQFGIFFGNSLTDPILQKQLSGAGLFDPLIDAAGKAGDDAGKAFSSSFQDQLDLLQAQGGGPKAVLSLAESQLPGAQERLARAQARFEKAPTKEHKAFRDFAVKRVNEIQDAIKSAHSDISGAAKADADKLAKARNDADQRFLNALGGKRRERENAVLRASGTAGLADDIKTQTQLRDFIKKSIGEAKKTLKDAKTRAETVGGLTTDLINANQKLTDLNKQLEDSLTTRFEIKVDIAKATGNLAQLRRLYAERLKHLRALLAAAKEGTDVALQLKQQIAQTQQAEFDAINEGFELDIQIAQNKEGGGKTHEAEIARRKAFIHQLVRERNTVKRGTLEYKRLTAQITEQTAAIRELNKAKNDQKSATDELRAQAFEFLQRQQGFAANLLGNLIPGGATTGLVDSGGSAGGGFSISGGGGGSVIDAVGGGVPGSLSNPVQQPLVEQDLKAKDASASGGPTRGQATSQVTLLREILHTLRDIQRGRAHPSAREARHLKAGQMDYE